MDYYEKEDAFGDDFTAADFMEAVAMHLEGILLPYQVRYLFLATKYPLRAGRKDLWHSDARKYADYICKAITGKFMSEHDRDEKDGPE